MEKNSNLSIVLLALLISACCCWLYVYLHIHMYDINKGFSIFKSEFIVFGHIYVRDLAIILLWNTIILCRLFGSGYLPFHKIELTIILGIIIFAILGTIWANRYTMEFCQDKMGNQLIVLLIMYFLFGYVSLQKIKKETAVPSGDAPR